MTSSSIAIDGHGLTVAAVGAVADGAAVTLGAAGLQLMARANHVVLREAAAGTPVYGVTTGLGPKVRHALSPDEIATFARKTVRGRAHALGEPLSRRIVRAGMAVRLNTLLTGASGAHPDIARHIAACLNADLVPHIGSTASVAVADLLWGGSFGLALLGEGQFLDHPTAATSAEILAQHGIAPLQLGPRDGLALISHTSFSAAISALGHHAASRVWSGSQTAAALSLEGFRGNLSPFRPAVIAARHQPGQAEAASDLLRRLQGSQLDQPGVARRLQDPLSYRNVAQVNGSVLAALVSLRQTLAGELNGASDNPVVLLDEDTIVSGGGYLNPHMGVCLVGLNHALVQLAAQTVGRCTKLLLSRFTDLPNGLFVDDSNSAGFSPITKVAEALFAEISQLATPPIVYPSAMADGVEDTVSNFTIAAKSLLQISKHLSRLVAIEMILAVHAVALRKVDDDIAPSLRPIAKRIRACSPPLAEDRSFSAEIETVAAWVRAGDFAID